MSRKKKERDAEFLYGPDISTCPRCGKFQHIWHIWGKGDDRDHVTGMVCTRCLWTCGDATIITAISCLLAERAIRADKRRMAQRKRHEYRRKIEYITKKWRAHRPQDVPVEGRARKETQE